MSPCQCCVLKSWKTPKALDKHEKETFNNPLQICCRITTMTYCCPEDGPDSKPRTLTFVKPLPDVKAGVILIYKNKVLIVQSKGNKWGFPKGGLKPGENFIQGAKREIKEETSLDIDLTETDRLLRSFNDTIMYYKKLPQKPQIRISYIVENGEDCTGIGWVRLSCLKKQVVEKGPAMFNSSLRKFVKHYFF